ncbi:RNA polymerase sigma factor, RpoD/SigA family [Leptolyngbya sp. FACHB-261]|uniref:RNA polymerase sigma factor, RpoD/SigA family n=1 Tax=Leptolyngbya sp. FACHB-261 TaxID=2692806 RepID=UPI001686BAB8|nr:RNA polymerase sigma factor, RpoD/SigA family [Leptolyngbya sp. FACHB-261]MBD2103708.1 RNA polymerase sigma factor, RpoD/SigA family [Leptolyngbya sp. FACHB-261]
MDLAPVAVRDSVDCYLNEIGRVPRVNYEEEIALSRQVRAKVAIEAAREQLAVASGVRPSLDQLAEHLGQEPYEIRRTLWLGSQAQQRLIRANLRLVVSVAKRYVGQGVPFLDLIQEGNIGLMRATEKFDPEKGYRFSTYSHWWIRQGITRAVTNQARTVRLPLHMVDKVRKLKRTLRNLSLTHGRRPTETELADAMGLKLKKLRLIQQVAQTPVSLDMPVGAEGDTSLGELLEDSQAQQPFKELHVYTMRQELEQALADLKPLEREILSLRFGLNSNACLTLQEIGEQLNLTRERVRQLEKVALHKLRRSQQQQSLQQYIRS